MCPGGRVSDSESRFPGFESHKGQSVVSLSKKLILKSNVSYLGSGDSI